MEQFILRYVPSLSSAGPWLSKKGAIYVSIIGFALACLLIKLGCIPSAASGASLCQGIGR